jgi:hypothetical protein
MPLPNTIQAYQDCLDFMDKAIDDEKGARSTGACDATKPDPSTARSTARSSPKVTRCTGVPNMTPSCSPLSKTPKTNGGATGAKCS